MNNLFERSSSHWVRYDKYELKEAGDGNLYVTPAAKAKPEVYDPLKNADAMVTDALNVGLLMMKRASDAEVAQCVMEFITKYGLLGLMTALPTTPTFMDYEAVYLPKNNFIKEETLSTERYIANFFPFEQPDFKKHGIESRWDVSGDRDMLALAMTFSDKPLALNMSLQREYAERYDWLLAQFKDWAFLFCTSIYYYQDGEKIDEDTKNIYRQAMAAFDGIAPSYHIALLDRPTIVWDFQSLLLGIQMMFSFALTDEQKPLRACKHCQKAFIASRAGAVFCSPRCKNQYNVYKSRAKDKE